MISSYIQGGLGNQMFQVAAGYAHALRTDKAFCLIEGQHYLPLQGNNIDTYKNNVFRKISFKDYSTLGVLKEYGEDKHSYKKIKPVDDIILCGYFQSEAYFSDYKDEIRSLFSAPAKLEKLILGLYPFLGTENSASLHIRRGDYLKNMKIHPTLGPEYYSEALALTGALPEHTIVMSDDIDWCKKVFGPKYIYSTQEDYIDLYTIGKCKNRIIANSTFSWWGAWLTETDGKVIAPVKWFGAMGPQDTQDILPQNWKKI
jgi:hypothetical protein